MTKHSSLTYTAAHKALHALAKPEKVGALKRFFKTGKGEYGEGDEFLGLVVASVRLVAKRFSALPLPDIKKLLASSYNEERLLALIILTDQFERGDAKIKTEIYRFYLKNLKHVNNWNLVDSSAHCIVGVYLLKRSRAPLYRLVGSKNLWHRRVAVLATYPMIRSGEFAETFRLTQRLLNDPEDLMHKVCGWMLREVGKKDLSALEGFLRIHAHKMPRTMLRYSIERMPPGKRLAYLKQR